jgi:hypothetical protein
LTGSLSLWERVRVRAMGSARCTLGAMQTTAALTPALSQREREEYLIHPDLSQRERE